jgi:hypothetical protein
VWPQCPRCGASGRLESGGFQCNAVWRSARVDVSSACSNLDFCCRPVFSLYRSTQCVSVSCVQLDLPFGLSLHWITCGVADGELVLVCHCQ